ncbi:hypothetical protein [Paenochrobactrum glaciei]|uniref:Uncharacterized protein n=1 Tax=Paenochrobactrum glaciei TaxID=486407 RepID=A0ABN1GMZ2_9HYPH
MQDLSDDKRLELICTKCNRLIYTTREEICAKADYGQLYLDEIEKHALCKGRGYHGHVRMAMVRLNELSGFVGGIA